MKKLFFFLTLFLSTCCFAQNGLMVTSVDPLADSIAIAKMRVRMDSIRQYRPTGAVVLAGGGARGMAHLGVLRYMEEMGIPVDLVGGTSMGGLVSGLYSLGYNAEYLDSLVRAIDWTVMMSDKIPDSFQTYKVRRNKERFTLTFPFHYEDKDIEEKIRKQVRNNKNFEQSNMHTGDMSAEMMSKMGLGMPDGFLFGFNVRNTLSSVSVGYQDSLDFEKLPIPFYCVATDMYSMAEKNWTSGDLVDAMRSTMAIPLYFRPIRKEGMVLVDGGTRNNFPVDVAKAMGADIVIGSEMPMNRDLADLGSLTSIALQNISMMGSDIAIINRENTDLLLQHYLEGYTMLSFDSESVADIISQGYAEAQAHKEEFEEIARKVNAYPAVSKARPATDIHKKKVKVGSIQFIGITEKEADYILNPAMLPRDGMYNREIIEELLSSIYGTRAFESVTYRMSGTQEPYTLIFDCQKGQTHEFGVGAHLDNDEKVYVAAHLGLGTRKLTGPRFIAEMKVGNISQLNLDFSYKPLLQLPIMGVALKNTYSDFNFRDNESAARFKAFNTRADAYIEDSHLVFGKVRFGFSGEIEPYEDYLDKTMEWKDWDWKSRWYSTFASLKYDTFDESYFPSKGFGVMLDTRYVFDGYSIYLEDEGAAPGESYEGDVPPYSVGLGSVSCAIPIGSSFVIQPSVYAGWATETLGHMNFIHALAVGGILAGRYVDNQLPFFGFSSGFHTCGHYAATTKLDLRYQINHKNFITLRGGSLHDEHSLNHIWKRKPTAYAFGAEIGRRSVAGPILLGVQWCDLTGVSVSLSLGFDF